MCSIYKKKGKDHCSAHYIRESQLAEIILDDLRRVTHYARQHEFLFAKHIYYRDIWLLDNIIEQAAEQDIQQASIK